jgi:uncharacterized protein YndB with AHSA1/START domain
MIAETTAGAVQRSVVVEAPPERAFSVFTEGMSTWWPLATHHIGKADAEAAVMEPRAGGRWYERGVDGSECEWGRVLAWEPPSRVLLSWQLNVEWTFDPDPAHGSEIEVRFTPEGDGRTRVELEHRGFERQARGAEIRTAVSGEGGWTSLLTLYSEAIAA